VLTDAPLPVGRPVEESRCGDCTTCQEVCPGGAVSGQLWRARIMRQEFYDAHACLLSCQAQAEPLGMIDETLCGRCIAARPWTQAYLQWQE
jgi:epoxyqueuosine reductase QueG